MTKSELLSTYTAEQLAEMVVEMENVSKAKITKCEISEYGEILKGKCDKCGEELILSLDNKHILCTKAEFYATQEANRQLNKDISELQSEVEKYRKAFEYAKKERDCQAADYQKKIEELTAENAELHCELQAMQVFPDEFPIEHIKVTDMLIDNAMKSYESYVRDFAKSYSGQLVIGNPCEDVRKQALSYLRQIAEHLLVYCNHNGEVEE